MPPLAAGTIVIPAWNEAARIEAAVRSARAWLDGHGGGELLVVDDGSTDATAARAEALGATVIRFPANRGKGAAVRAGMLAAAGDPVLFADADLSTPIEAWELLRPRHDAGADVVFGVRTRESVRVRQGLGRVLLGRAGNWLVRGLLAGGVRDTQCGFKSFRRAAARAVFERVTIERFGFDMEVLVIARRRGLRLETVPVPWTNDPRSTVRPVRDALRTFRELGRIFWNKVRGRYDG
jgi:glycosyltransferase involved in cell wall biosynthesis